MPTIFPVLGLVLALMLSPCKVRNFIQAELGAPVTEVTNKSKTALGNVDCAELTFAVTKLAQKKSLAQVLPFADGPSEWLFDTSVIRSITFPFDQERNHSASPIPLYILYRNFKHCL